MANGELVPTDVAVYAAIARHANTFGVAWPSIARLSKLVGKSESTVKRAIRHLEAAGSLRRELVPGRTSTYRLTDAPAAADPGGAAVASGEVTHDRGVRSDMTPEQDVSNENQEETPLLTEIPTDSRTTPQPSVPSPRSAPPPVTMDLSALPSSLLAYIRAWLVLCSFQPWRDLADASDDAIQRTLQRSMGRPNGLLAQIEEQVYKPWRASQMDRLRAANDLAKSRRERERTFAENGGSRFPAKARFAEAAAALGL